MISVRKERESNWVESFAVEWMERKSPEIEALITQLKERARNLYATRQFLCTEAVLVALNSGLKGGLTEAQAVGLSAPFCVAMGESGCLCGALSGAVMACGLFLGSAHPYRHRTAMRNSARRLHDAFKAAAGATCCRVLSHKVQHDAKAHFRQCAAFTADAAEMAIRLILYHRPGLLKQHDAGYLSVRQSKIGGTLARLWRHFIPFQRDPLSE